MMWSIAALGGRQGVGEAVLVGGLVGSKAGRVADSLAIFWPCPLPPAVESLELIDEQPVDVVVAAPMVDRVRLAAGWIQNGIKMMQIKVGLIQGQRGG